MPTVGGHLGAKKPPCFHATPRLPQTCLSRGLNRSHTLAGRVRPPATSLHRLACRWRKSLIAEPALPTFVGSPSIR